MESPKEQLLSLLRDHQTDGFFVGENIPERKLQNAIAYFPIDPNLDVFGLIDSTVMGSCKCGMAITDRGLVWKNDWTTHSSETLLSWDELVDRKPEIKLDRHDILFGKGARLNLAGASMKKVAVFHLIMALIHLLEDLKDRFQHEKVEAQSGEDRLNHTVPSSTATHDLVQIDLEQGSLFEESLIQALALMTVADGNCDEDEIDLAIEFIKEEESISDKVGALSRYEEQIEKLSKSRKKSKAMFKLQSEKAIGNISKLTDETLIGHLEIMLEGMVDVSGDAGNADAIDMMKRIMTSLK